MVPYIFIFYSLVQLGLLVLAVGEWRKNGRLVYLILPIIVAALVYDNFVVGTGIWIGEGQTLQTLNFFRFLTHVLFTPLLCILGLMVARNAGVDWAWNKRAVTAVYSLTAIFVAIGLYADVFLLNLSPVAEDGTLRYVNIGWEGPPIAAILTMGVLLFVGISVIVETRWYWLLVGSLAMFLISGFAATIGVVANLGEIILIASLLGTLRHFPHQTHEAYNKALRLRTPAERQVLAEGIRHRKRKLAIYNRQMAWVMFPILIIGTVAFYRDSLNLSAIPAWVDYTFNTLFILLFFIHTVASFYFYGIPKPHRHIRVVHVYIGYAVFLFTMVSQSLIGVEPIHMITYVINWLFIGAHVVLSTYFMLKRNRHKQPVPSLEIRVKVKETTKVAG